MKIKLQMMTVSVKIKRYHHELLGFVLIVQALLVCCQGVEVELLGVRS